MTPAPAPAISQNRAAVRRIKFEALKRSGLYSWWKKKHRSQISIVMLHATCDASASSVWQPLRAQTSPADLEHAIVALHSNGHTFISLRDALDILDGKREPVPNAVVLSFDDGYRSNLHYAAPILRKHSVPAAFFVVARNSQERVPLWFDRLDYAIQHAKGNRITVRGETIECTLNGKDDRAAVYAKIRFDAKRTIRDDRKMQAEMHRLAEQLEEISGRRLGEIFENDPWSSLMTMEEIRQLAADPLFEIGSHTMDHYRLDALDPQERARQLTQSREWVERVTGRRCEFLCFPNGNFNPEAVKAAASAGYRAALTNQAGLNVPGECGFALNRIAFPERASASEVCVKISGLWNAMEKRTPGWGE